MTFISDLIINNTALRIKTGEKLNKLWSDIGDKSQLLTSNRTSLVNAINEVKSTSLSSNDSRISNWDTSFEWGNHVGKYLNLGDNRIFRSKSVGADLDLQRDSVVYSTGANRPSNTNSTVITLSGLSDYGFQIAARNRNIWFRSLEAGTYNDWQPFWHGGNLVNPATKDWVVEQKYDYAFALLPTSTDTILGKYYAQKSSVNADDVKGNIAFYTQNNTVGSLDYYHHLNFGTNSTFNWQLRKSPTRNSGFGIRTKTGTSTWTDWEEIAYQSWVESKGYWYNSYIKAKSALGDADTYFNNTGGYISNYNTSGWLQNGAFSGYGGLIEFASHSDNLNIQFHYENGHNSGGVGGRLAFRTKAATYNKWHELWHTGNMEDYHQYGIGRIAVPFTDITSADIQLGRLFRYSTDANHRGSILSMPYDGSGETARTNLIRVHGGEAWISNRLVTVGSTPTWIKLLTEADVNPNDYVKKIGDTMTGPLISSASTGLIMKTDTYALLERDMVTISGAWARTMHRTKHNDNVIDIIGHYGNNGSLTYGYIGGTNWNSVNAIRWTSDGKVGIGLGASTSPQEILDVNGAVRISAQIGNILSIRDGHSLYNNVISNSNVASGVVRQNWTANNTTYVLGGVGSSTSGSMSAFGIYRFLNDRTENGQDGFFGFAGNGDQFQITNLAGTGNRMVVANSSGTLSTQTLPTDTTYSAGTLALLNTGTDTSNRVWKTKDIADYVISKIAQGADSIWEHTSGGGIRVTNYDSLATRDGSIAFGRGSGATKLNAIALGTSSNSDGNDGIVVGPLSVNLGTYGTVVGPYSVNTAMEGVVTGPFLQNNQRGCTVTGRYNHPIQNATTNTINNYSPLFIIGNGKSASIRSNAYEMFSDGKGEFANVQSYKNQHSFGDMDIPNWKFIQDNIGGGDGNGSEDWVSNYGSQISVFEEQKANEQLGSSPYGGTGEILADQKFSNVDKPTLVYLGNDGIWRKWNNSANAEQGNLSNSAVLGIALGDMKSVLLRGYYLGSMSIELETLVTDIKNGNMFHSINKGLLMAGSSTSFTERVFGYSINESVAYFNPWMF